MSVKITAPSIAARKRRSGADPIVMITAYDTPFADIVDDVGVDIVLVGDSVADNVLGYESTLSVGMADLLHHTAAVARARPRALVVADLPWMSYHVDAEDAVRNAAALIRAGAEAVKLEGGAQRSSVIRAITNAEIPVMGHLGLTPQSVNVAGGLRVQAKDVDSARRLIEDAHAICALGCFAVVLEGVPDVVAREVTAAIDVPTIGIGAGPHCDGQVLVLHDVLGLAERPAPKFVRRYGELGVAARTVVRVVAADVRSAAYPADAETYHGSEALRDALGAEHQSEVSRLHR